MNKDPFWFALALFSWAIALISFGASLLVPLSWERVGLSGAAVLASLCGWYYEGMSREEEL